MGAKASDCGEIWQRLESMARPSLAALFAADPGRVAAMSLRLAVAGDGLDANGMLIDWSKTHLDDAALTTFEELAEACGFAAARAALFDGGIINPTEGRAATHGAMRGSGTGPKWRRPRRCWPAWACWSKRSMKARWAR